MDRAETQTEQSLRDVASKVTADALIISLLQT